MPISWKLIVGLFMIPYAAAALFTAIMYQQNDIGSVADSDVASYKEFLNLAGNPQEVAIDQPGVGSNQNPISTELSYPVAPTSWLTKLGQAVSLTGPIWEPWTAPIRLFLYTMAAPALLIIAIGLMQAFSFFISSIFGRLSP